MLRLQSVTHAGRVAEFYSLATFAHQFPITPQQTNTPMKYMLTWTERPQGSPIEYENAQKRILEVFTQWKAPANFRIELFVIRVGDWGGYMMLDCDDPAAVHKFCSLLPA